MNRREARSLPSSPLRIAFARKDLFNCHGCYRQYGKKSGKRSVGSFPLLRTSQKFPFITFRIIYRESVSRISQREISPARIRRYQSAESRGKIKGKLNEKSNPKGNNNHERRRLAGNKITVCLRV